MAREPQPRPYPGDPGAVLPGRVVLRKVYADALGRPMSGTAMITNRAPVQAGDATVPASTVRVDVVDGTLEEQVPPGTYVVAAQLRTVDGDVFTHNETVTVASVPSQRLAQG